MSVYLLDTNVCVEFLRQRSTSVVQRRGGTTNTNRDECGTP